MRVKTVMTSEYVETVLKYVEKPKTQALVLVGLCQSQIIDGDWYTGMDRQLKTLANVRTFILGRDFNN